MVEGGKGKKKKQAKRAKNDSIWNMFPSLATFSLEVCLCCDGACSKGDYKNR